MQTTSPAILLDLDGTIVDSAPGILDSCRAALRDLGHAPPKLAAAGLIGPPIEEIMGTLLAALGDDRVEEGVAAYREDYGTRGLYGSLAYPGIGIALAAMQDAGYRLLIATSKRRRFAVRILEHLELADMFDGIHGSEDGGGLDRKPELIAHVIAHHGLLPNRCLMVGDRRHDILGAKANGMRSLGVLWGYGTREELIASEADGLVEHPADLPAAALVKK